MKKTSEVTGGHVGREPENCRVRQGYEKGDSRLSSASEGTHTVKSEKRIFQR